MNIGLIGAGRIGRIHAEIIKKHVVGAKIIQIAEPMMNEEVVAWAASVGVENVVKDFNEVLKNPDVDAVFICSSTDTHTDVIKASAKAGKDIFCEKPISFDIDAIIEALNVVKECGVKMQIGFNRRFDHNFRKIHDLTRDGKVGDVHYVKVTSRDCAPPPIPYIEVSGGIYLDMMIHDFDMARYLAGSEVDEVYATGNVLIDPAIGEAGDIDTAVAVLKFENGAIGIIDDSRQAVYGHDQRVEVIGSGGCPMARNDTDTAVDYYGSSCKESDNPIAPFRVRYEMAYATEVQEFVNSIKNGTDILVTGYDGLQPILIALAAKESLAIGKPVKVRKIPEI